MTEPDFVPGTDLILELARIAAGDVDDTFLLRVVDVLRRYMDASIVFVGIGAGDPVDSVEAIYAVRDGAPATGIAYELTGAPCELVYQSDDSFVVPCDLAQRFPREAGFESYIGVPLRGADGTVFGHFAVFSPQPVTDSATAVGLVTVLAQRVEAELRRKALEDERNKLLDNLRHQARRLRARQRTIREQNAYKTRLLGIIAHDLRSPLSAIISQAELAGALLAKDPPPVERVGGVCEKVVKNADRMSDLIDATLNRVREEDGNLALDVEACVIGSILRLTLDANRAEAERKNITLEADDLPEITVQGDDVLLTRAIDNLVSNAVKYTDPGGWVRVSAMDADDGVCICVTDNGQGLSEEDQQRAFGRFQTLSAKPTGGEAALGLGLSNVREIVEAHHGALSVTSAGQGQGATFTIVLPRSV